MPPENHQVGSIGGTQLLEPLEFGGVPFSVGERRILDCQHGVQYYKPKKGLGKRNRLQGTRKIGCKAHIVLREYILYPDYSIAKSYDSKRQERLAKEEQLKILRADLDTREKVKSESRYCFTTYRGSSS